MIPADRPDPCIKSWHRNAKAISLGRFRCRHQARIVLPGFSCRIEICQIHRSREIFRRSASPSTNWRWPRSRAPFSPSSGWRWPRWARKKPGSAICAPSWALPVKRSTGMSARMDRFDPMARNCWAAASQPPLSTRECHEYCDDRRSGAGLLGETNAEPKSIVIFLPNPTKK